MKVFCIATLLVLLVVLPLTLLVAYFYSALMAGMVAFVSIIVYIASGIYAIYEIG